MNELCFSTNMTSAEWAAWVQAIFSVIAIVAAAGTAIWQARAQHRSSMNLHIAEQRHSKVEMAKTLQVLTKNCASAVDHLRRQLSERERVHLIAGGEIYFDEEAARALENAVSGIPLWSLPNTLVGHAMSLHATMRQFREKVEGMLRGHREMDGDAFTRVFRIFSEMSESLSVTAKDIEVEVGRIQNAK